MSMIEAKVAGSWDHIEQYLHHMREDFITKILKSHGEEGVRALERATPVKTGLTASSWTYEIVHERGVHKIIWENTNVVKGFFHVALALQYGHGTGGGGWVEGRDYINPAIQPIMDKIVTEVMEEVRRG